MARLVVAAAVGIATAFVAPEFALQAAAFTYGATGFLDPKRHLFGSKLDDLKAPKASYGSPIPYIEGAPRVPGVFFWSSDKRAVAHTESVGKGGPGADSTTYSYEQDHLIGLAINECAAIRRIWSNGKLVWSHADDADGETVVASAVTNSWRDIRFYSGDITQLPDPVYEAAVGVGNAPAYRGRTTVFIEGLNLGGSGQLPILTFEVLSESASGVRSANFATFPLDPELVTEPFIAGITRMDAGGFDFLYGINDDVVNGGHTGFIVYHCDSAGTITPTNRFDYGAGVGSGTGKEGVAMQGNADVSCLALYEFDPSFVPALDYFTVYLATGGGTGTVFQFGRANQTDPVTFSLRGTRIATAGTTPVGSGGFREIRIYNATTGGAALTTTVMPAAMQFCAIGSGVVYALSEDGNSVYVVDLVTGVAGTSIATPVNSLQSCITCDSDGGLYLFSLGTVPDPYPIYKWDGTTWTRVLTSTAAIAGNGGLIPNPTERHSIYASDSVLAVQYYDSSGVAPYRERFSIATPSVAVVTPSLADVVSRLCLRTGQLSAGDFDVTALEPQTVRGMALTQVGSTRQAIENLMLGYLFEAVVGDKIVFVLRGGAAAVTIPYADLGAGRETNVQPLPLKRLNDNEIPALISVKFANTLDDFRDGLESGDRLVTTSEVVSVVELPLGFTPTEAKRLADANTMDQAVSGIAIGPISTNRKYAYLEPTDVVILTDEDGSTFRARIVRTAYSDGVYTHELTLDDATAINSAAATDSGYTASTFLRLTAPTDLTLLDAPLLRDVDDDYGLYAAVGTSTSQRWPGAQVSKSLDDVTFGTVLETSTRAVIGHTSTVLGDFGGGNVFDEANSLTVNVGASTLSSTTRDLMLTTDANALMVGSEIIQFRTATFVSAGVYTLTGLLRGRRGTEWAMAGHATNESVVLLEASTLRRITENGSDRNVPFHWRAVTLGSRADLAAEQTLANTDVGLKPFAPADLRDLGGVLTWHRRSRLSSRLLATTDPPLGEASESYDVELRDSGDALVESATVAAPTYTLVATPGAGDYVTVWQNSDRIGRGYPAILEF